ncbi:hypothetical protein AALO_G00003540 [Alosa alosa]|uniref:Uncharacterized protein n=1 Tax=Alosa alosa TaxID=278164 RepID=A0AAV6HHM5_9TELE|nr:hypothetical protein AALO_G00003540 [Alosa alosa]
MRKSRGGGTTAQRKRMSHSTVLNFYSLPLKARFPVSRHGQLSSPLLCERSQDEQKQYGANTTLIHQRIEARAILYNVSSFFTPVLIHVLYEALIGFVYHQQHFDIHFNSYICSPIMW